MALDKKCDAVITIGCIIKGETPHFDFIGNACANGIMNVGLQYGLPIIFGVLTTNDLKQAKERSGGKHGNKGIEAAETALKMIALHNELIK
jgi:6,7-dimethyl-8-ribityllumazine synthase